MPRDDGFASSPGVRRRMQAIRRVGTEAELRVRRELFARGLRYRVNVPVLPGSRRRVDIVFPRRRVAVFVDGCFWHGCSTHGRREWRVNREFWTAKVERNRARDRDTDRRLADAGWTVVRIWEHDDVRAAADRVQAVVRGRGSPPEHDVQ